MIGAEVRETPKRVIWVYKGRIKMKLKILGLLVLLGLSLVLVPQFGASFIPVWDMYQAFSSPVPTDEMKMLTTIVQDIRFPRLLYSVMTGIGLSLVGVLMQTVTRNALADPYVLGVSSGASTGAVFAIIMGGLPFLGNYNVPFFAALGAGISILLVLLCVGRSQSPVKLILIGMGMTGIFSSITMMISKQK